MQFSGVVPEDAPDPSLERWARLRSFPHPIVGLVPQPTLGLLGAPGGSTTTSGFDVTHREVALGYSLWRHPDDRDDPRNLAELDDATRRALEEPPPWPRPAWLIEAAQMFRYPMVWEAVRTYWVADGNLRETPAEALRAHAAHILVNRFREELGLGVPPSPQPQIRAAAIEHGAPVELDGAEVEGVRLDTDPFVYGVGADLGDRGVFTAAVPRDDLPFIDVRFRSFTVDELVATA